MSALDDAILRLKRMKDNADKLAKEIVESNPTLLSNLNREQLRAGTNANGNSMPSYVSNSKAPQAPGGIELFDTGRYHAGIKPLFGSNEIVMTSIDQKVRFLDPKYPLGLGLSPESIIVVQNEIKKELPSKLLKL